MLDLLCAGVKGEFTAWPGDGDTQEAVLEAAGDQGVDLLIAWQLRKHSAAGAVSHAVRARFEDRLRVAAIVEQRARASVKGVLGALAAAGVDVLLLKGAAIAYTHYPDPALRPRLDVDVLIRDEDVETVSAVLERLAFVRAPFITGTLVSYQVPYALTEADGFELILDVHWRLCNPQLFSNMFSFDELWPASRPLPVLGPHARGPGSAHALAIACVHRVAHHHNREWLIWLYDIHRLLTLSPEDAGLFLRIATQKWILTLCADGIAAAQSRFGAAPTAMSLLDQIRARAGTHEPSAAYVGRRMSKVDELIADLRALDGWGLRFRLLSEHVFPPARYMREVYGPAVPLPALYVRRVMAGAGRWFRR